MKSILQLGDCLDLLPKLADNSADIVFTSPPYNMNLRIRNGKHCSRQIVKEMTTKYENFSDNMSMQKYFLFNSYVITECLRVAPIVFYNVQFLTGNKEALFRLMGVYSEYLKEVIIWDKVNAQPAIGKDVLNSQFETILVFDRNNAISRKFDRCDFKRGTLSNLWQIKREKSISKEHKAVFPLSLATKVIESFTFLGDTVLDPFMGTGTTGVACSKLGRKFIGMEIDPTYFNLAQKRIGEADAGR